MEFPRYKYTVEKTTTSNTLTIYIKQFEWVPPDNPSPEEKRRKVCTPYIVQGNDFQMFFVSSKPLPADSTLRHVTELSNLFLCFDHYINDKAVCSECYKFLQFPSCLLIRNDVMAFYVPPPIIFAKNNYTFFVSVVEKFSTLKSPEDYGTWEPNYRGFIETTSFRGGFITKQLSGKSSYFRVNCLGSTAHALRGTLIISEDLMPGEVMVPKKIYDSIDFAFPYVLLNRDPSINSRSIYVCKIIPYENDFDCSIKINQFVLRGLHGDQDGDEVNLYYIKKEPISYQMQLAYYEMRRKSWDGFRHDILGRPRYSFSQQQDLILDLYNDELCRISPLWNSLQKFGTKKIKIFWSIGCFTHRDEVDEFLKMFLQFCKDNDPGLVTYEEMLNASGVLTRVVTSGAKGSDAHLRVYREQLIKKSDEEILDTAKKTFNKYVQSNHEMKLCGRQHSGSLHIYQNGLYPSSVNVFFNNIFILVYVCDDSLFFNDTLLVSDIFAIPLTSIFLFNPLAVKYAITNYLHEI
jgi:hypothetical protein